MHIKILGTAAAEGWPGIFCGCKTCVRAREASGKNMRSRASVQFDDRHKIDLPPDTWYHVAHLGADLSRLEHLFITHSHGDHLATDNLTYLGPPFAHDRAKPLHIYGNATVLEAARDVLESHGHLDSGRALLHEVEPFIPVQTGDMTFTPVIALHKRDELCLNYVAASHDKTMLYASDTGWYCDDTWRFLEGTKLDCVIAECTMGPHKDGKNHMDFEHLFAMKDRLEQAGVFDGGVFLATHFSHNVGLLHDELEHILGERGIRPAYDGMEIVL